MFALVLLLLLVVGSVLAPLIVATTYRHVYAVDRQRGIRLAISAALAPVLSVVAIRLAIEHGLQPTSEGAMGADWLSIALGLPIGWILAFVLTTFLLITLDSRSGRRPQTLHEKVFGLRSSDFRVPSQPTPQSVPDPEYRGDRDVSDYTTYTLEELRDAAGHINRNRYPDRARLLDDEVARRLGLKQPQPPTDGGLTSR